MWSNILPLKRTKTYLCQWLNFATLFFHCVVQTFVCVMSYQRGMRLCCLSVSVLLCSIVKLMHYVRLLLVVTPKKITKKPLLIMWTATYHDCGSSLTRFSSYKKKWNHVVNHTWGLSYCFNRLCFRVLWHIRHAMKTVSPHFLHHNDDDETMWCFLWL